MAISTMIPLFLMMGAMIFYREWKRTQKENRKLKEQELMIQGEAARNTNANINIENSNETNDLGGYVTIPMLEDKKSLFHDLLKGFEYYASLKGYKVSISIDTSISDSISFKIVVNDFGVTANRQSIKEDLNEYIESIQNGSPLENLPEVLDPISHAKILAALKNRISFLQQNYQIEKNIREFYEEVFKKIPSQGVMHAQPIFNITNGATEMDQRKYIAKDSPNAMLGDNHQNSLSNVSVNIGNSFAEKQDKVNGIEELINLIKQESFEGDSKALRQLENVKEELVDESEPDKSLIEKCLTKAGAIISSAEKCSGLIDKAEGIFEGFGISM
jgi:hypothetical protein